MSSLGERVEDNGDAVDIIERALSNPVGAGLAAETMLENTLKSFGLTPDMDYVLQPSVGGEGGARLRPDALVFMPGDAVLVIDSKASKYLLELARADGESAEDEIYAKLRDTMNQHLRDLAGKNYRNAVQAHYRSAGRADEVRQFINIMWLPNDAAVEKVRTADPDFLRKAWGHGIMVVGPTGLWTAIGMAKMNINLGRQAENRDKIVESVHALVESLAVMLEHAGGIGRSLRTAANFNVKLSGSINSRVLPRMRKLIEQGIESPTKGLPSTVPSYQVVDIEMADVIDTESDLVEPVRELPAPAGE